MNGTTYSIELLSDAEPGTGLGGVSVNDRVTRDHEGRPCITASHIKGLMRRFLCDLSKSYEDQAWADELATRVLGRPGEEHDSGDESCLSLTSAKMIDSDTDDGVATTTRTAIDSGTGTVIETSLRVTEHVSVGRKFEGTLRIDAPEETQEFIAARLALMSISAIGSSRTRGCGTCLVSVDGETRTPGALLKQLAEASPWESSTVVTAVSLPEISPNEEIRLDETCLLGIVFQAEAPVCCPEFPVRGNLVKSGFAIPASAVQGMILTRLQGTNPEQASRCYEHPAFRAWPLLPCGDADADLERLPQPCRVSLTHRTAKILQSGGSEIRPEEVGDEAIEPYDWKTADPRSPLKASDGVLLRQEDGTVMLWKSGVMPRVLSAHCVMHDAIREDGRNLFSVEAMAPLTWRGIVQMPEGIAEAFVQSIETDPAVAFGRGRSIRGQGTITTRRIDAPAGLCSWTPTEKNGSMALVAQSPILLPDSPSAGKSVREELKDIVVTWANDHGLPEPDVVWTAQALRFGWNRSGDGRQRACRIAVEGSVIRFEKRPDDALLAKALRCGVGGGREAGFGSMTRHPGLASSLKQPTPSMRRFPKSTEYEAVKQALDIFDGGRKPLPSASQIYAVQQRLAKSGKETAKEYLVHQTKRTPRIWYRWKPVIEDIEAVLDLPGADHALRMLADLSISEQTKKKGGRA